MLMRRAPRAGYRRPPEGVTPRTPGRNRSGLAEARFQPVARPLYTTAMSLTAPVHRVSFILPREKAAVKGGFLAPFILA